MTALNRGMNWLSIIFILSFLPSGSCFISSNPPIRTSRLLHSSSSQLSAVSQRYVAVIDGGDYKSLLQYSGDTSSPTTTKKDPPFGTITVTTGTTSDNRRVVGIEQPSSSSSPSLSLSDTVSLSLDSVADIPSKVSNADAASTLLASLTLHCALPTLQNIGGASGRVVSGTLVIVGGGAYAQFACRAAVALGASVVVATTAGIKESKGVKVCEPSSGEMEIGFCDEVGEFDAMLDTLGDERGMDGHNNRMMTELKRRYNCHRYVSSFNEAQRIIRDSGVLFGPGEAKSYARSAADRLLLCPPLSVPSQLGPHTLQKLLNDGILFPSSTPPLKEHQVFVRGWSLKEFWEGASWPMNAEGGINARYGFPVIDDIVEEEETDVTPTAGGAATVVASDPNVCDVPSVSSLQNTVLNPQRTCLLFLSASWCRTCRKITPQYNRMARMRNKDNDGDDDNDSTGILFAKTVTDRKEGKELSKLLKVDNVPTFVMFREGRVFGKPFSLTRLPDLRLNQAIEYLETGWEKEQEVILMMREEDE